MKKYTEIAEIKTVSEVSDALVRVSTNRLEIRAINISFVHSGELVAKELNAIKASVMITDMNDSVKRAYNGFFGNIAKAYADGKLDKDGLAMLNQVANNKELFKVLTTTKKVKSLKEAILEVQAAKPGEAKPKSKAKKEAEPVNGEASPLLVALAVVKKMSDEDIKGIKEALKPIIKDATLNKMKPEQAYIIFEALKAAQLY